MNIYGAASLFAALILLYWIISEVFTVLFRLFGLPEEKARFQVTSLLTACGFTTQESEIFLSTRSRRKLVRVTMLFGFIFNITIVSAFINVFVSLKLSELVSAGASILIPIITIICILVLAKLRPVKAWFNRLIEKLAAKITGSGGTNRIMVMEPVGDSCIAEVILNRVPEALSGKTLVESGIRTDYQVMILLLERKNGKPEPPVGDTALEAGDRLTAFGEYKTLCRIFEAKEYFADPDEAPDLREEKTEREA